MSKRLTLLKVRIPALSVAFRLPSLARNLGSMRKREDFPTVLSQVSSKGLKMVFSALFPVRVDRPKGKLDENRSTMGTCAVAVAVAVGAGRFDTAVANVVIAFVRACACAGSIVKVDGERC